MKTRLLIIASLAVLGSTVISPAESKRTADYLLTTPLNFEGKDVTVDVAFVKPVHWVSPIPGISFFHAITIDRSDYQPGGVILVAIAADGSAAFAKKYGTEPRRDADSLKGIFQAAGGRPPGPPPAGEAATDKPAGPKHGTKIWIIDTTGQLQKLAEQHRLELPDENVDAAVLPPGGPGGPGRKRGPGPR